VGGSFTGGTGFGSRSDVTAGWTLGGGGEWLLDGNWSIKAEYLYVDFGSMNVPVNVSNTPEFTQTMVVDADLSSQVARVGLNFRP
jgi:outer membrane immunogenic protein